MTCLGEDMEAEVDAGCIMEYLWMLVMIIAALLSCSIGITTIRQVSVEITNNNRRMSLYRAKMQEWVVGGGGVSTTNKLHIMLDNN